MTPMLLELPAPPRADRTGSGDGPGRGFVDCRGRWHRLDEPDAMLETFEDRGRD